MTGQLTIAGADGSWITIFGPVLEVRCSRNNKIPARRLTKASRSIAYQLCGELVLPADAVLKIEESARSSERCRVWRMRELRRGRRAGVSCVGWRRDIALKLTTCRLIGAEVVGLDKRIEKARRHSV